MPLISNAPVACFGEVLWDILPSGKQVGGAPFNVCYHLDQLGLPTKMISCIGEDEDGIAIRRELQDKKMSMDFLQTSTQPTGTVVGQLSSEDEMVYTIVEDVAWDQIQLTEANSKLVEEAPYFIFGSLAARSPNSRSALLSLLERANCAVFDVNLRAPFFNADLIAMLLHQTTILKINEKELDQLSAWFGEETSVAGKLQHLTQQFNIDEIVLTRGAHGALIYKDGQEWIQKGKPTQVADTVGSGDAFLAGYLFAKSEGLDTPEQAATANTLAAWVTQSYGACPPYTAAIREFINHSRIIKPRLP